MLKVAVIGTGNIGMDLLVKLIKLNNVEIVAFIGRRPPTKPIPNGINYSAKGINYFIENPRCCQVVFDCTNAENAVFHASVFREQEIIVVDLTPSKIGKMCIPFIGIPNSDNINMVTCGGQACIPLLHYLSNKLEVTYAEVVTQIASDSAGLATRYNIDKYIETTENAIKKFTRVKNSKVILNINPLYTTIMQTSVFVKTTRTEEDFSDFDEFINKIRSYIPNYSVSVGPTWVAPDTVLVSVNIIGSGDYLSKYSGNLDVINCAAIHVLKQIILQQSCQADPQLQDTDPVACT
jgi:acetaldehyde dehydrogenase (acetylating)